MQKSNKASSDDHIPARKSQRTQWRVNRYEPIQYSEK